MWLRGLINVWTKTETKTVPNTTPSLYWAYYAFARLGGWHNKRTGIVRREDLWVEDVKEAARAIENSQRWVLDVTFSEDESLIYAEDGAKNTALFRHALLKLIKAHPPKDIIAGKMMRAGWDSKFSAEILFGQKSNKV
jgi:hypothetical protein